LYAWEWQAKTGMNGDQETAAVAEPLTYLGSKIREARHSRGLTLKDLAGKVGLTASHISQIERGLTGPSVSAFWNIATALDVPMEYFFNHEGDQLAVAQSTVSAHTMLSSRQSGVPPSGQGPSPEAVEASRRGRTNGNQASPVVLPGGRETINIVGGIQWQKLTPTDEDAFEFLELHYPPGASSGDLAYAHRGREFGRVLQGTLLVELGFARHTLQPGDSIAFDCSIPHRFINVGNEPFVGIWVILDRL
jgi:transcriptional regulator with XRE-family HTH domain/mannose-6-phosphate isomerase-like protein (cupin superfamily)